MKKILPFLGVLTLSLSLYSCSTGKDSTVMAGADGVHSAVAQGEQEFKTTDKAVASANEYCDDRYDNDAQFLNESDNTFMSSSDLGAPGENPKIGQVVTAEDEYRVTVRFKCA